MTLYGIATASNQLRNPTTWLILWLLFPFAALVLFPLASQRTKGPAKLAALTLLTCLTAAWLAAAALICYSLSTLFR